MSQESKSMPPRSEVRGSVKKKKKTKKKPRFLTIFFSIFLTLLVAVSLYLGYLVMKTNDAITSIGIDENKATQVPIQESVKEKPVAFVFLGLDARPKGGSLNTDVIKVAAFAPGSKTATVISIPRDTYIDVEGYRPRKANAFYADFYSAARKEGKDREDADLAGKKAVRDVLGKYLGIEIKYAASINFQGFSDVVDAVGGVGVNVDIRMKYIDKADGTNIDLEPGFQTLDGDKALDFVRYRKSNRGGQESSDFDRGRRQSEVIGAILDKLISLGGLTKVGSVIDAASANIDTDMPESEIRRMLETYVGVKSSDISFMSLEGVWRSPYVYADQTSLQEVKAALSSKMAE